MESVICYATSCSSAGWHTGESGIQSNPYPDRWRYRSLLPRKTGDWRMSGSLSGVARYRRYVEHSSLQPANRDADLHTVSSKNIAPCVPSNPHTKNSSAASPSAIPLLSRLTPQRATSAEIRFAHSGRPRFRPSAPATIYTQLGRRPVWNLQSSTTP